MTVATDRRPDPLFSEAPAAGSDWARYHWRRAQGTACGRCGDPIEGRTWEVQLAGSAEWLHVRCVTGDEWAMGPAPESGQGLAPLSWERAPRRGSARADAVARALLDDDDEDDGPEPVQEVLWP